MFRRVAILNQTSRERVRTRHREFYKVIARVFAKQGKYTRKGFHSNIRVYCVHQRF